MAINFDVINKGAISLNDNFYLLAEKPLDSRGVVKTLDGIQTLIDNGAAYAGMVTYVTSEKRLYEVYDDNGTLKYKAHAYTEDELKALIGQQTTAAMEFKGATATLPENPAKGDMYKVAGENISITIGGVAAKTGDSIVYDGEQWYLIPSGDDIEDTWRAITGVDNDATLSFVNGDKITASVAADGTVKFNHDKLTAAPADVATEEDKKTRTYLTAVEVDEYGHVTNYKTATENVEDTNTTYEFECQVEDGHSNVHFSVKASDAEHAQEICLDAYTRNEVDAELAKKVDKVEGYSLVSDTEIARLADVDNYNDEEVRGLIGDNADAIDALSEYVGTIPNVPGEDGNNKYADLDVIGYINKKAQETLAAASGNSSETAASVKGQLDDYIGENNTRVKAIEDDVAAIKNTETGILKQAKDYADGLAGNYDEAGASAAVQTALEAEIAKKVDKVEGKSLIDDSEIARLSTLANYDDTQVKADIAKKADAETMTTELGKKVDKVDGKDLIATSEIERLATLKNYDDTALAGRVTTAEGKIAGLETESAKHALKSELAAVDAKFADYTKTAELPTDLDDFTNNAGYAKTADVNTELDKKADKTQVATDIANAIAPLATTEALNGVKATAEAAVTDAKLATALEPYAKTADVSATYETKSDASSKLAEAKKYTDDAIAAIPAQTDYTVTITETTDGLANDIAKKYTFTQNGAEIGTINLAKELVVTSGSVKEVAVADAPYAGAKVGDKYIELVIANQDTPIYVPAKDLVDVYTAKNGAAEVQVAISNTNEISATLVNGGITEEKLDSDVKTKLNKTWEEVGVAAGLVEALENGQVKANKEAIEKLNGADTVDGSVAKSIKDAIANENLGQYAKTADLGDLAALDTITADKVTDFATEVAKVKVNDAAKADEATKATQDGAGNNIADTYATKNAVDALGLTAAKGELRTEGGTHEGDVIFVNIDGADKGKTVGFMAKPDTNNVKISVNDYNGIYVGANKVIDIEVDGYTKAEVESLLSWGSF